MRPSLPLPSLALAVVAAALVATPSPASSQLDPGVQAVWSPDVFDGSLGIGGRVGLGLGRTLPGLELLGVFDWFFPDCGPADCDFWELAAGATYAVALAGSDLRPYFGGGLTYQNLSTGSSAGTIADADDLGFHVLGGLEMGGALAFDPFLELRYDMMSDFEDMLVVSLGVAF